MKGNHIGMAILLLIVTLLCCPSHADVVHLKKGTAVEGRVTEEGDVYEVETKRGKQVFPASTVAKVVEKKTDVDIFYERAEALGDDDSAGHAELGEWCLSRSMSMHAAVEFMKALGADPMNLTARVGLARIKAQSVRNSLKKLSQGRARSEFKKMKALAVKKVYVDIQPLPTSEVREISDADFGFQANLAAKGYKVVHSEKSADAVYRAIYKSGLAGSYEADGRTYRGRYVKADISLTTTKDGKEVWKGEAYGFTGARVQFKKSVDIEAALRTAAIEDFLGSLSRELTKMPLNADELKRRLEASANLPRGGLKRMVAGLDTLLIDLTKDQIDKEDVLGCYGYPQTEEFDEGGINRWSYEKIGLVFEWHHPKKDVTYSIVEMRRGYPGGLYGIKIGQPFEEVKETFRCKLVDANTKLGTLTFVVSPMPSIKGVTRVTSGPKRTVELITIEFGKPGKR